MVDKELSNIVESVKEVVRRVAEHLWPDEVVIFEMTLGQLKHWPRCWERVPSTEWKAEDLLKEAADEGFCFPGTIPAGTPPWSRFATVVAAVAEHFRASASAPAEDDIESVYKKLGSRAELSEKVLDVGRLAVIELVRSYFLGRTVRGFPVACYIVYEGRQRHVCNEESELEEYRNKKNTYDIYVDDLRCEILVGGEKPDLRAGETYNFSLLKCLLKRVGAHWTHDELFEEVGIPDPTDMNTNVSVEVERRSLLHRRINAVRKSLSAIGGKNKVKYWFDTENPKRVVVAADLNSCLIESLS